MPYQHPVLDGITSRDTLPSEQRPSIEVFTADGTINIGAAVMLDTGDTGGMKVVEATSGNDHRFVGIYNGTGGTSTPATAAEVSGGLSGRTAVAGDPVEIVVYGKAVALLNDTTSGNAVDGRQLAIASTAGSLTDTAATGPAIATALEAFASSTNDEKVVFVRAR